MAINVTVDNPDHLRYISSTTLVTASDIGALDDTWVDQGSVLNTEGFRTLVLWVELTVNDSTGNQLQVLCGDTSSTATRILPTASQYQYTLGNADITGGIALEFNLANIVKNVQIQTKATDVDTGGGTEGTVNINYSLGY